MQSENFNRNDSLLYVFPCKSYHYNVMLYRLAEWVAVALELFCGLTPGVQWRLGTLAANISRTSQQRPTPHTRLS